MVTAATADGNYTASCLVTVSSAVNSGGSSSGIFIKQPFLKDNPDKKGWNAIWTEVQKAAAGSGGRTVSIDMNETYFVPDGILTAVRGRDVTVVFDLGDGVSWSVYGKDIVAEKVSSMNLSVKAGAGKIPKDILEGTAGASAHLELRPARYWTFGFTAVLTIQVGISKKGISIGTGETDAIAGMYANLFAYDSDQRSLEFICADRVGDDGTVHLPVARASDWTMILSAHPMGGIDVPENPSSSQDGTEPENPQETEENTKVQVKSVKLSKTVYTYSGKAKKPVVIALDRRGRRVLDKYYTVSYQNNVKVGKAAAVISFKNGYSGTVKKTFTICPAGVSIKKTAALSGGFTVKWAEKTAQTSGYQIQYSRTSGFERSSTHSVFVKKASMTKRTVKKLKAGKKYYVRIRTYKVVKSGGENTTIYSVWSKAVPVRVL